MTMKASVIPPGVKRYKLAQLCQASGFHASTVHHYVKLGLLHKPRKIGLGLYLYDDLHLKKLYQIRSLREKERLPLSKIKEVIERQQGNADPNRSSAAQESPLHDAEGSGCPRGVGQSELTRQELLDAATNLFSKHGYEGTTVNEITQAVGMSKGAFYLYFEDKRRLFIECIERLPHGFVPERSWQEVSRETDYSIRLRKRTHGFLEAFPSYAGILHLVKMTAMGEDQDVAQKAREALARIVNPFLWDFRRAVADGVARELDERFFGYLVMGMLENAGYKLTTDPKSDLHECVETIVDLLERGFLSRTRPLAQAEEPRRRSGTITDIKGERVRVREICFGGKPYLAGRIGEGEVRSDTDRIAFIRVDHTGRTCRVELTMTDGGRTVMEQDSNLIVSAASSVGWYAIPFHLVRNISFD